MLVTEIVNLPKLLPEVGKIKIGYKGEVRKSKDGGDYRLPQKLDHFIITTNERDENDDFVIDSEIHALQHIGQEPKSIPIRLLYNEMKLNFISRYAIYKGKEKCICEGDGVNFYWLDEKTGKWELGRVPAEEMKPDFKGDKCKLNGILSCVIDGVNRIGGVWKFRTVGKNSVISLKSSMEFIYQLTGGQIAGIPLNLVLRPKSVNVKDPKTGKPINTKIYVANLEYRGTVEDLQNEAYKIANNRSLNSARIMQIEQQVLKQLETAKNPMDEEIADTVDEFYPENNPGFKEVEKQTEVKDDITDLETKPEETSIIPDLSLPEEKEIIDKIAKMRTDAIAKVNEADSIEKLETLKKGIGYKDEFGSYKSQADQVIIDVLKIINDKITELTPKEKPMTDSELHELLKEILIRHGLDCDELRNQFYKNFGANKEYLKDTNLLITNVEKFKKAKINGTKAGLITKIAERLTQIKERDEDAYKAVCELYSKIDKTDFKAMWKFWQDYKD